MAHGARGAPPMDGAGAVIGSDIVYTSTCGKHVLVGYVRWVLVPKYRIKIFGDCVRINRRLIGRISEVVLLNKSISDEDIALETELIR